MSILPYDNIVADIKDAEVFTVMFSGFNCEFIVREQYCVNPNCSCTDVVLVFIELSKDKVPVSDWFMIRLDLPTWKVTEKQVYNKMIKADKMIKEFLKVGEEVREKLLSHHSVAKEYGRKHYLDYIDDSVVKTVLDGEVIPYSSVLGISGQDLNFITGSIEEWVIDDYYCSNPKCHCNEAFLNFIKIDNHKEIQDGEFTVRLNINTLKYDIECVECDVRIVSEIMKYIKDSKPEFFDIIRTHYREIKRASTEIIKKFGSRSRDNDNNSGFSSQNSLEKGIEKNPVLKVRRNDPCPCGSGKKFKKCCGANMT